jgi:hypothetical protein
MDSGALANIPKVVNSESKNQTKGEGPAALVASSAEAENETNGAFAIDISQARSVGLRKGSSKKGMSDSQPRTVSGPRKRRKSPPKWVMPLIIATMFIIWIATSNVAATNRIA